MPLYIIDRKPCSYDKVIRDIIHHAETVADFKVGKTLREQHNTPFIDRYQRVTYRYQALQRSVKDKGIVHNYAIHLQETQDTYFIGTGRGFATYHENESCANNLKNSHPLLYNAYITCITRVKKGAQKKEHLVRIIGLQKRGRKLHRVTEPVRAAFLKKAQRYGYKPVA